jgi:fatty acid desaturase
MSNLEMELTSFPVVNDSLPSNDRSDPRISMQHLPMLLQPFLTWVSGKPMVGQIAQRRNPFLYLFKVLALLGFGVFSSVIAVKLQGFGLLLLIFSWMITVSSARQLQVVVVHHCAHKNFSGHRKLDKWIGRIVSALMFFRDFDGYERSHTDHHRNPLDADDETVKFLRHLTGIEPGKHLTELWRRLWISLISPKFHIQFLVARLISSLLVSSLIHRTLSWLCLLSVLFLMEACNAWLIFWVAWVFPLTVLYQVSTLLRLCSEHIWLPVGFDAKRNKSRYSQATVGIFLGDPVPSSGSSVVMSLSQWILWWSKLLIVHLPMRIFVLVGDTSCHDYHHRYPGSDDWANAVFTRQQDVDAGCPGWLNPYREVVGLFTAINLAFISLSQHPALEQASCNNAVQTVYATKDDT